MVGRTRTAVRQRRLADSPPNRRRPDAGDGRKVEHEPALESRPASTVAVRAVDIQIGLGSCLEALCRVTPIGVHGRAGKAGKAAENLAVDPVGQLVLAWPGAVGV